MKADRIAWKPQNTEWRVASARIRCLNILRHLQKQGYPIELYRPRRESRYKTVIFSKAYNPRDVETAQRLRDQGVRIVFDLCDNHFLSRPDRRERLLQMYALADHWVVSSEALGRVVRQEVGEHKPLTVIEDAVEDRLRGELFDWSGWLRAQWQLAGLRRFLSGQSARGATALLWFGNHKASYADSGLAHLQSIRPLLEQVNRRHPVSLTVVSGSRQAFMEQFSDWHLPSHYLDWNAHSFFRVARKHRITLIPIQSNSFTAVKTNNRIAQSLWLGLGVVADEIESYRVFSQCAFLDNWETGLQTYLSQPDLMAQHVARARDIITERFSVPVVAGHWRKLLEAM